MNQLSNSMYCYVTLSTDFILRIMNFD